MNIHGQTHHQHVYVGIHYGTDGIQSQFLQDLYCGIYSIYMFIQNVYHGMHVYIYTYILSFIFCNIYKLSLTEGYITQQLGTFLALGSTITKQLHLQRN